MESATLQDISDVELLSFTLGKLKNRSSHKVAKKILKDNNYCLFTLGNRPLAYLKKQYGLTKKQAKAIYTTFAMARQFKEHTSADQICLDSYQVRVLFMAERLRELQQEEVWVVFLNDHRGIIKKQSFALADTNLDDLIKIIMANTVEYKAPHILLYLNHTKGVSEPNETEIEFTKKVVHYAELLNTSVLDCIIFAKDDIYSFKKNNKALLENSENPLP